ncbi:hypothetical protein [Ruminococcus flavefaciens]|uniref:hypothetical protein n=1 Tax=Ruminococcus flavefaciens TaxID=1265 RepID=UPI0026EB628B|nr:hypothetical protein [Ruminococcus flavefaciens]
MKTAKALLASSLIAAALLTGCADSKKNSEIKVGDVTIDLDDVKKEFSQNKEFLKNYLYETPKPINAMSVEVPGGNIVVEHSGDEKSGLALRYKVFADSEDTLKQVDEHIESVSEVKENVLMIKLVEAESGEDLESWLKKNIPDCRVEYDTYITVPEYVTDYRTKCGVGNISFTELSGSFTADVSAGNITFSDTEITGPSVIKCNVGNIQMNGNTYKAKTDISAETGNIVFCLPLNGSDGADISVKADTGNIQLTGIKNYEVKSEEKKKNSHSLSIEVENCNIDFAVKTGKIKIDKE